MSNIDIKTLLACLDGDCLAYLEKASQFCVQQHHAKVSVEHYLLQMLDEQKNPFNQLLLNFSINPVDLIRQLLLKTGKLKQDASGKPMFSQALLSWFESASRDDSGQALHKTIHVKQLIISLINNPGTYQSCGLDELEKISEADVLAFFDIPASDQAATPVATDESEDKADTDSEHTVVMNEDELSNAVISASDHIDIKLLLDAGYGKLEKIGEGGMASVYKAVHLGLDREVALKVLKPGSLSDDDFAERFLREARIVAKLAHPNIIQIYDVNQISELTYLAMEFVSGGELSERIDDGIAFDDIIRILSQVLSALQSAHDKGYIHRDIKPENILFREDDSVVLTDFGIARVMGEDSGLTIAGSVLGTPRYMSPEQAKGESLDNRSDLYSVGVLFFHMLERKLPYKGESAMGTAMKHILDPVPTLSSRWSGYQPFIDRAMAKEANDRFQSGSEMTLALQSLTDTAGTKPING